MAMNDRTIKLSPPQQLAMFEALAQLYQAALPLDQCIAILIEEADKERYKQYLTSIQQALKAGASLSEALNNWQHNIDALTLSLIQTGEQTGQLPQILNMVVQTKRQTVQRNQAIKQALFYPCISLLMGIGVLVFMMYSVVPQFQSLYQQLGQKPPALTQELLAMANQMNHPNIGLVLDGLFLAYVLTLCHKLLPLAKLYTFILAKLPLLGSVIYYRQLAFILHTMAIFAQAAMTLPEALRQAHNMTKLPQLIQGLERAQQALIAGESFATAIHRAAMFPQRIQQMLTIADASNTLPTMLNHAAEFAQQAFDKSMNRLQQLLEPLVLSCLGVLIGGLMITMYLPLFRLGGTM